jgi:hypothetical protein
MSPKAKIANRVAGWGRAFPTRSIAERNRETRVGRGTGLSFSFIGGKTSLGSSGSETGVEGFYLDFRSVDTRAIGRTKRNTITGPSPVKVEEGQNRRTWRLLSFYCGRTVVGSLERLSNTDP